MIQWDFNEWELFVKLIVNLLNCLISLLYYRVLNVVEIFEL